MAEPLTAGTEPEAPRHTAGRGPKIAAAVAILVLVGALVFAVTGIREDEQASGALDRTESRLPTRRAATADARAEVAAVDALVKRLGPDIDAALLGAENITKADEADLALFQEALAAGTAGSVAAYNRAVGQRNALNALHDKALDGLRAPADALVAALDRL